jgi:peptide methionine sulfoxide reductase msrA/msrB
MKIKLWITMLVLSLFLIGCAPTATTSVEDEVKEEMIAEESESTEQLNDGELAVNFEFLDYDGNTIKLEDLRGEKVYLKVWASWCPICNRGLPELEELFAKERDYIVYSVVTPNAGGEKSIEDFKAWFSEEDYPNVVVLFDENASFTRKLGALSVPTSVYIGSDGVLIKSSAGHSNNEDIEAFIKTFE